MRLADLRKKFDASQDIQLPRDSQDAPRWWIVALGVAILVILVCGTWYAGRQSATIQDQRLSSALDQMTQQMASLKLRLAEEIAERHDAERALTSVGKSSMVHQQTQMRRQISELQAAVGQYKGIIDRQESTSNDNIRLTRLTLRSGGAVILDENCERGGTLYCLRTGGGEYKTSADY